MKLRLVKAPPQLEGDNEKILSFIVAKIVKLISSDLREKDHFIFDIFHGNKHDLETLTRAGFILEEIEE
ncbi:MAG: hypothetical protein WC847_00870 [Candidatus Paceibacterota bacterium]|jgi:hypothetical protein